MTFESLGRTDSSQDSSRNSAHERLSPTGQMIGWGVFGGLVLMGFAFGIVVGVDHPRPAIVAKNKEQELPRVEAPRSETPRSSVKADLPRSETPKASPKIEPPAPTVVKETPAPKPVVTPPPKVDPTPPKTTPKPPAAVATTTPKTEPATKKEELKAVSFRTDVLPVLRKNCLECHGLSKGKPRGDVDLTTIAKMKASPGKMLVIGDPDKSDVYNSITDGRMPPEGKQPRPTDAEKLVLKNWILSGAKE